MPKAKQPGGAVPPPGARRKPHGRRALNVASDSATPNSVRRLGSGQNDTIIDLAGNSIPALAADLDEGCTRIIALSISELRFVQRLAARDPDQERVWLTMRGLVPADALDAHAERLLYWAILACRESVQPILEQTSQRERNEDVARTLERLRKLIGLHPLLRDAMWAAGSDRLHAASARTDDTAAQQERRLTAVPMLSSVLGQLQVAIAHYLPSDIPAPRPRVGGAQMIRFREVMFDYLLDTYGAHARKAIQHIVYGLCFAAFPDDAAEHLSPEATDRALRKRIAKRHVPTQLRSNRRS